MTGAGRSLRRDIAMGGSLESIKKMSSVGPGNGSTTRDKVEAG
jgi:hypothetical protein